VTIINGFIKHWKVWCGYVSLTSDCKFYNTDYNNINVSVHGGLTYGTMENNEWVIGFDCGHNGDLCPGWLNIIEFNHTYKDVYRDKNFVINECESLAEQASCYSLTKIRDIKLGKLIN